MNILLLQTDIVWENQAANYKVVQGLISSLEPDPQSIICLPELFSTGYTMNSTAFQEKYADSRTLSFLADIAQTYHIFVIGSLMMYTSDNKMPRNSSVVLNPRGNVIYRYDKIHLLPLSGEPDFYQSGSKVSFFTVGDYRFSVVICYDLRFPEIFRILYQQHVDGIFVIANWPAQRQSHWETLIKARAIENQCYIFAVNRVGSDPSSTYQGGTSIISPQGESLGTRLLDEGTLIRKIDPEISRSIGQKLPFRQSCNFPVYKSHSPYNS